jgi:hypothetical protein
MRSLLALSLFAASLTAQSVPAAWKLAHPDAKALIGVDVRSLRDSSIAQSWTKEIEKASTGVSVFQFPGMDLLKDIDQVFISSPGGKTANPKENPPFLIVLTGHFDPSHLGFFLKGEHRVYKTVNIYGTAKKPNGMNFIQLDEQTLVLGDEASLHGAIDRRGQTAPVPEALLARASAMAAVHDFWLIATVSPSAFQPANMKLGGLLSEIRGIDTGFSLRDGFRLELGLTTKTPDGAQEMSRMLSEQMKAALAMNLDDQQSADLLRKLEVNSDGTRLGVKIALTKEEVDRAIRTAQSHRQIARAPRAPLPDDQPKTIKILGLDDGPREIPLK